MEYEPRFARLEATSVVHDGARYIVASVAGRPYVLEAATFDLFFKVRLVESPEPPERPVEKVIVQDVHVRVGKRVVGLEVLSEFPEVLRGPRAAGLRAVWQALHSNGPADLATISDRVRDEGVRSVSFALHSLREKGLVRKPEGAGGAWSLV